MLINPKIKAERGFSLLEMAVVLVIVSALLGGLLMSLGATQEMNRRNATEARLQEIVDSLYGFAQVTGRLPCPATAGSGGAEAPVGGGACTRDHGFVPAVTLGISGPVNDDGLLLDEWLNPYRYSVSDANGNAFTTANGMRGVGMAALNPDLRVCAQAACVDVIASSVPVVLLSMGADWAEFTAADVDATENSGETTVAGYRMANDDDFVSTGYIEDVFDDQLVWISANILFTRMISAGQLP
jgi:prepilin-type N-terminal cleavage/methylation domain-containing protein